MKVMKREIRYRIPLMGDDQECSREKVTEREIVCRITKSNPTCIRYYLLVVGNRNGRKHILINPVYLPNKFPIFAQFFKKCAILHHFYAF